MVVRQLHCERSQSWHAARQMVLQGQTGETIMSVSEVIHCNYRITYELWFCSLWFGLVKTKSNQHWATAVQMWHLSSWAFLPELKQQRAVFVSTNKRCLWLVEDNRFRGPYLCKIIWPCFFTIVCFSSLPVNSKNTETHICGVQLFVMSQIAMWAQSY